MTISRLLKLVMGTLAALALVSAILIFSAASRRRALVAHEEQRFRSYQLADQLRHSSDELTRFARTYVVTRDPRYDQYYHDVLDIRAGRKPLPEDYERIYWDLLIDGGVPPRPSGPPVSLQQQMVQAGFTAADLAQLQHAMGSSDSLVSIEETAMHAVRGQYRDASGAYTRTGPANQALAVRLLHDSTYHHHKARIMAPIDSFLGNVENRTSSELSTFQGQTTIALRIATGIFVLFLLVVAVSYPILRARIIVPVRTLQTHTRAVGGDINRLANVSTGIAGGNLRQSFAVGTLPLHSDRRDEIGDLARLHDTMLVELQETGAAISKMTAGLRHANEALKLHVTELDRSRNYLQSILESTPVSVAVTVNGITRYANPGFRELFAAEVGARSLDFYADPGDRDRLVSDMQKHGSVRDRVLKFRARDGRVFDGMCALHPIDFGGEAGILGWIVDVSKIKEAEEALRNLERLRDDLVNMIVHDMRSPLTVLLSQLQLMKMDATGDMVESVNDAMHGARALNQLANTLLDVNRLEEGKMPLNKESTDLAQLARGVADDLSSLEPDRTITVAATGAVMCSCDAGLVRRVMENLVSNAIKHTPRRGAVTVAVSSLPSRVRVAVQDEGQGVPVELRTRIFEKFGAAAARKDNVYHSVGLGLAFCKLTVEAHGGTIAVQDAEPRGSVFAFELPA